MRAKIDKGNLKGKYKKLYYCISAILFENDIEGINFVKNEDEYEPEVGTILPRLPEANSIEDVQKILQEEFGIWFGKKRDIDEFRETAKEIWAAWLSYTNGMS